MIRNVFTRIVRAENIIPIIVEPEMENESNRNKYFIKIDDQVAVHYQNSSTAVNDDEDDEVLDSHSAKIGDEWKFNVEKNSKKFELIYKVIAISPRVKLQFQTISELV